MLCDGALKKIEETVAKAREGPWHWWEDGSRIFFGQVDKPDSFMISDKRKYPEPDTLNFMTAARTWIPQLLEVIWKEKEAHSRLYEKHLELQQKLEDVRAMLEE